MKLFVAVCVSVLALAGLVSGTSVVADTCNDFSNLNCAIEGNVVSNITPEYIRDNIAYIVQVLSFILAAASVLFIVFGGIRWMVGQEEEGKKQIRNALIGLTIIIFAYVLTSWVVGFLSGTQESLLNGTTGDDNTTIQTPVPALNGGGNDAQ